MSYRSQNHYKGICAKCGKEGYPIAKCRHATADEKAAFFKKVKETKARKASAYQNIDKYVKRNANKKVKFNDNKTSQSSEHAAMTVWGE